MAILISFSAAATEAGSAEWAEGSDSEENPYPGGVPGKKKINFRLSI